MQAADSVEVARAAPFVEKLVAEGTEVLYLTEAIDEAVVTNLAKFGDHDLVDVTKEGLDVGEVTGKKVRQQQEGVCRSMRRGLCMCPVFVKGVAKAGCCCFSSGVLTEELHGQCRLANSWCCYSVSFPAQGMLTLTSLLHLPLCLVTSVM